MILCEVCEVPTVGAKSLIKRATAEGCMRQWTQAREQDWSRRR